LHRAGKACSRHHVKSYAVAGQSKHADLESWLTSHGGEVHGAKLEIQQQPDGKASRTLKATKDIAPGAVIISVPKKAQLRYDGLQDAGVQTLMDRIPTGSDTGKAAWQFKQACVLLHHLSRGADSPLQPHIQSMPGLAPGVGVPCVGMLLHDDLIPELQSPSLQQDVQNHKYWWDYFTSKELGSSEQVFNGMKVDRDLFGWAVSVVISRCFALRRQDTHSMPALIDMADHSLDGNAEVKGQETGEVAMYAKQAIKAGEPITITYGQHSNAELLLSYGFVLPSNPSDRYVLDYNTELLTAVIEQVFGQWANNPLSAWQVAVLDRIHGSSDGSSVSEVHRTLVGASDASQAPIEPKLLASMRILMLKDESQSLVEGLSAEDLGAWDKLFARQHEIEVMKALSGLLAIMYRSLPTTIQQDRELIKMLSTAVEQAASKQAASDAAASGGKGGESGKLVLPPKVVLPGKEEGYLLCLQFRLSMKLALEGALKGVQARMKELQSM